MKKLTLFLFLFLVMVIFTVGCGKKAKIKSGTAQELYADATNELYNKEGGFPWIFTGPDYDVILETLKEIQLRYTFSPFATLAEIRTADTYFKKEEYEQAITEYEEFIKNHPGHNEYEYALYQLALSNYELRASKDRDPTFTRNSIKWFTKFIEEYPNSQLIPSAEEKVMECRKILAAKQLSIGKFYMKKKNYKAALDRFNIVLEKYSDTKYSDEAYKLINKLPADTTPNPET
ncbi:MAG: outer membrane protein assembly factor BamD [Thermodesulfobacteriota bacterium]